MATIGVARLLLGLASMLTRFAQAREALHPFVIPDGQNVTADASNPTRGCDVLREDAIPGPD